MLETFNFIAHLKDRLSNTGAQVDKLQKLIADQVGFKGELSDGTALDDLGFDSLDRLELVLEVEEQFKASISDAQAYEWRTLGDVRRDIERQAKE